MLLQPTIVVSVHQRVYHKDDLHAPEKVWRCRYVGKPFDDFCDCLCHIPDQLYTDMFYFV